MKRKRHTAEHIIAKLRQAKVERGNGATVANVCKKLGVSEQTYQRWRQEYGGMGESQLRRLKDLERDDVRLKKIVAQKATEQRRVEGRGLTSKELVSPQGRRRAVWWVWEGA